MLATTGVASGGGAASEGAVAWLASLLGVAAGAAPLSGAVG
jgi:hypothetical protein